MDDFWGQTSPVCDNALVPVTDAGLHFGYNQVHAAPSYMTGHHLSAFSMVANGTASNGIGAAVAGNGLNSSQNNAPIGAQNSNQNASRDAGQNSNQNSNQNASLNSGQVTGGPVAGEQINAEPINNEITVTPASQPSYSESMDSEGMDAMDGNSMDSTRQIDCEVLIDENPANNQMVNIKPESYRQHQLMQRKTNYKVNIAKYHQVTKRELSTLIAKKDPGIHYTEVKSRKSELVNNYNRINYGDKETEFVQCLNCKDLLCYSSYDGTTSVSSPSHILFR